MEDFDGRQNPRSRRRKPDHATARFPQAALRDCQRNRDQQSDNTGQAFIERISKRVRLKTPLDEQFRDYAKSRLTDGIFRELRKTILEGPPETPVLPEIQDLYLADAELPSRTGRLVEANWKRYPYLATSLELVKKGTYSALTRSLVLQAVTPREEQVAFAEYDPAHNPLKISDAQAVVLLFCLVDNDAEVAFPFFQGILALPERSFNERVAGDLLPDILTRIVKEHGKRNITIEERDRLTLLAKTADSIECWKGKAYTGGGARQETVRLVLNHTATWGSSQNRTGTVMSMPHRTL